MLIKSDSLVVIYWLPFGNQTPWHYAHLTREIMDISINLGMPHGSWFPNTQPTQMQIFLLQGASYFPLERFE